MGQVGEVATQMLGGVAKEPGLRGEAEQRREHRHGQQLGITQLGAIPTSGRQIRSDGLVASSSSISTYGAVAKVSISVSAVTSKVDSLV